MDEGSVVVWVAAAFLTFSPAPPPQTKSIYHALGPGPTSRRDTRGLKDPPMHLFGGRALYGTEH